MNKAELIDAMSKKTGVSKKNTEYMLNAFMECVEEALVEGKKVQLVGFGSFEAKEKKARPGRNPKKPDVEIIIPASTVPVFKAGKNLKDSLNA